MPWTNWTGKRANCSTSSIELGIADNTIVLWSTDNGTEIMSTPEMGGMHAFRGEKGLTNEGGFRVPQLMRWPGHIKPGTIVNDITSHDDWMPTLLAAANGGKDTGIQEALKKGGFKADGKTFKAHLDGYNQLPLLTGKVPNGEGPRQEILYFTADGDLSAVRWGKWKISFIDMSGNLTTGLEEIPELAHHHELAARSLRAVPGPVRDVSPLVRQADVRWRRRKWWQKSWPRSRSSRPRAAPA